MNKKVDLSELKSISQDKWNKLTNRKIYFGHQSVGFNIIDGIKNILSELPNIKLNIQETNNQDDFDKPILAHSKIGKNFDPISKCEDFKTNIENGIGNMVDIAFLKFCYVDIDSKTDINTVFKHYVETMEYLKTRYPKVKFLHCTVPLTITPLGIKTKIKRLIQYPIWTDPDNIKRCEFNSLLLEKYGREGDVFDLAKCESTYRNKKVSFFIKNNKKYYSLLPEYSNNGGHLNKTGKLFVGMKLLEFLVSVCQ
jgi:hypothetical protein